MAAMDGEARLGLDATVLRSLQRTAGNAAVSALVGGNGYVVASLPRLPAPVFGTDHAIVAGLARTVRMAAAPSSRVAAPATRDEGPEGLR